MDPFTASTTVATLVGLLSNFVSEGRARDADAWDQFRLELDSNKHKILLEEISSNHLLVSEIKKLLESNHDELKLELEKFNGKLTRIASTTRLHGVTNALAPDLKISKQAITVLGVMDKYKPEYLIRARKTTGGGGAIKYNLYPTKTVFTPPEPQFIESDLDILVGLGFLKDCGVIDNGYSKHSFTRDGHEFFNSHCKESTEADAL